MKKKVFLAILMMALLALVLAFSVSAADVNIDGVYYNIDTSKQTAFITTTNKGSCKVADLVIPSTVTYNGVEYPVKISENAFNGNKNIKTVTIDGGVLDVGYRAFYNCTAITKVVLGEGLNPSTFNTQVFVGCKAITDFTIPSTMTAIRSTMLQNCTSLTSITIPSTVTKIENSAFEGKIIGVKVSGGLIGYLNIVKECTIKNSYANVDMNVGVEDTGTASISGGLIGQINRCNLTISDCAVTGTITSKNSKQVSALFGHVTGKANTADKDNSYAISCSDVLLAISSTSYDSVLGTLDTSFDNITWTVENVKYDSSLVAENLPISVGTTTLNATGDTTVNLKGTNAGFTDWAIVENDYPLPAADLIPEIDVDTYKNYVAPVVPGDGNNDNGNNDDGNNDDGNNDSGNNNGGSDTEKATEAKTDANTDAGKTDKNSGCASSVGMTAATVLLLGVAVAFTKKKKD